MLGCETLGLLPGRRGALNQVQGPADPRPRQRDCLEEDLFVRALGCHPDGWCWPLAYQADL